MDPNPNNADQDLLEQFDRIFFPWNHNDLMLVPHPGEPYPQAQINLPQAANARQPQQRPDDQRMRELLNHQVYAQQQVDALRALYDNPPMVPAPSIVNQQEFDRLNAADPLQIQQMIIRGTRRVPTPIVRPARSPSPPPGPLYLRDAREFGRERSRHGKDCMAEIKKRAECPVCFEDFQDVPKRLVPLALQCGHLICGGCLKQVSKHAARAANPLPFGHISCPLCSTAVPSNNLPAIKEIVYFARQHELAEIEIKEQRETIANLDKRLSRKQMPELISNVNKEKKKRLHTIKELQIALEKMANATAAEVDCKADDSDEVFERFVRLERKKKAEEEANADLDRMADQVKRMAERLQEVPVVTELEDDDELDKSTNNSANQSMINVV